MLLAAVIITILQVKEKNNFQFNNKEFYFLLLFLTKNLFQIHFYLYSRPTSYETERSLICSELQSPQDTLKLFYAQRYIVKNANAFITLRHFFPSVVGFHTFRMFTVLFEKIKFGTVYCTKINVCTTISKMSFEKKNPSFFIILTTATLIGSICHTTELFQRKFSFKPLMQHAEICIFVGHIIKVQQL